MIKRIEGNETTKKLITDILKVAQKNRPPMKHVDYSVSLIDKHNTSELHTDENNGILRNISIININPLYPIRKSIKAAIGNQTGNILLEEKPLFMSTKKTLKKIQEFLTNLQLANRNRLMSITQDANDYGSPETMKVIKTTEKYKNFDIINKIDASNYQHSSEVFEPYKTL